MSNITKATVATVKLGDLEIEGLMLPDGSYAIAFSQLATLKLVPRNRSIKQLKSRIGGDFPSHQSIKTELNSKPVNVIDLEDFTKIVKKLARSGNERAFDFLEIMAGLSLRQLFADAFGEKFEVEERQEWLKQRMAHRQQFHPCLTKWLQIDGVTGKEYGKQVNLFKAKAKCPLKSVSEYDSDELHQLNNAEVRYDVLRRTGMKHVEAVSYLS